MKAMLSGLSRNVTPNATSAMAEMSCTVLAGSNCADRSHMMKVSTPTRMSTPPVMYEKRLRVRPGMHRQSTPTAAKPMARQMKVLFFEIFILLFSMIKLQIIFAKIQKKCNCTKYFFTSGVFKA